MWRQRPFWIATLALALVLTSSAGAAWWLNSVSARGREAQQHLLAAREALSSGASSSVLDAGSAGGGSRATNTRAALEQLATVCAETARADSLLRDVGGQMRPVMPVVEALRSAPVVGSRARTQTAALETGSELAAAGTALCTGAQPLADLFGASDGDSNSVGSAQAAFQSLLAARPKLGEAADRLDQTLRSLANVSDNDLDPAARAGVEALRARLPPLVQTLRDVTALLDLLGATDEHHFLLVSQNPDELRATGGYIGSAGVVAVGHGTVRLIEYGSSRVYDTPASRRAQTPAPFNQYLGDYWELAGANWWASYPDVARQLAYFYGLARPEERLDGVVALDQVGLGRLLEVLGPVDVSEFSERVSAADLQAALDRHVHAADGDDEIGRKQFTGALSAAVLGQMLNAPKRQLPDLMRSMRTALDEQHLLVAVWDPGAAAVLARRHWDGALLSAAQDSLMVVDTDIVASKQSQAVRRSVAYEVELGNPSGALAHTTITYTNQSEPHPFVTYVDNYRTFTRVYAPAGAVLLGGEGLGGPVSVQQECGRTVFGGEVLVPRAATVRVRFSYQLPSATWSERSYDLVVQQQPGVPAGDVSVLVKRPDGQVARVVGENSPGRNYHWQLGATEAAELQAQPADLAPAACGTELVRAVPIAAPAWLEIPAANISAPVVDIGVEPDGIMQVPPTPDVVGWYRMSARAGQPGNGVFAGHVDWGRNTAVFWGLHNLAAADSIILRGADGAQHHYAVEWNRVFSRSDPSAVELVRGSSEAILTLITCDGVYDRSVGDYSERRIVRAILSD